MRNTRWLAPALAVTTLLTACAGSAQAPAPTTPAADPSLKPSVITPPDWTRIPTAAQVGANYPDRALRMDMEGRVNLRCKVTESGALTDCAVASETPEGYGFGKAALQLSKYFAMRTTTVNGAPVAGATVNISIPFRLR